MTGCPNGRGAVPERLNILHAILAIFLFPKVYAISPISAPPVHQVIPVASTPKSPATASTEPPARVYTQAEIDEMTARTFHPYILRTLIKCESQNTNVARIDSNGVMSYGLLQFNGSSTWNQFARPAGVSSTPMNPTSAIQVADYMISIGQLHRWTCAYITSTGDTLHICTISEAVATP